MPNAIEHPPAEPTLAERFAALAAPFPQDQVERLPKVLRKDDQDKGRCERERSGVCADEHPCGGWHAKAIHLSYIGHAGVTMRLNSVDPTWYWEPMGTTAGGTPVWADGGLWVRLHVLGAVRIGYGDAGGKSGPNAIKEAIGDAIRNAAMRYGVGTYLWSKSEAAQVIAAGGDPDAEPQQQQAATAPARNRQQPHAEKPSGNVQRVFAAMQPLSEQDRGWVRDQATAEFGADLHPGDMTDAQAQWVVTLCQQVAAQRQAERQEAQDPPA